MMTQTISNLLFYLFALLAILFALGAVRSPRILRAAVSLMVVLLSTAALYAYGGAHFMAGIQVLVYVGGIVVLLVFAVMLTQTNELVEAPPSLVRQVLGFVAAVGFFAVSSQVLLHSELTVVSAQPIASADAASLGRKFLDYGADGYALPFEVISLLLLASIIGGIVIAKRMAQKEAV